MLCPMAKRLSKVHRSWALDTCSMLRRPGQTFVTTLCPGETTVIRSLFAPRTNAQIWGTLHSDLAYIRTQWLMYDSLVQGFALHVFAVFVGHGHPFFQIQHWNCKKNGVHLKTSVLHGSTIAAVPNICFFWILRSFISVERSCF